MFAILTLKDYSLAFEFIPTTGAVLRKKKITTKTRTVPSGPLNPHGTINMG